MPMQDTDRAEEGRARALLSPETIRPATSFVGTQRPPHPSLQVVGRGDCQQTLPEGLAHKEAASCGRGSHALLV